jgi:hypothetical protein
MEGLIGCLTHVKQWQKHDFKACLHDEKFEFFIFLVTGRM